MNISAESVKAETDCKAEEKVDPVKTEDTSKSDCDEEVNVCSLASPDILLKQSRYTIDTVLTYCRHNSDTCRLKPDKS